MGYFFLSPLLLLVPQLLVHIPPPSDSPQTPRSEPPSPLTGSSPPPPLLCPQMPALPLTPTSLPAAVYVRSSRVVGATRRSALSSEVALFLSSAPYIFFSHHLTFPLLISGIRPLSRPESSGSPDEGSCVHPPKAQVPAGGDAWLWPNQSTAPDLFSGSGQASFGSWSRRRERRRRRRRQRGRKRRRQQFEQQSPSLSSGPGVSSGCRGDETNSHKPPFLPFHPPSTRK